MGAFLERLDDGPGGLLVLVAIEHDGGEGAVVEVEVGPFLLVVETVEIVFLGLGEVFVGLLLIRDAAADEKRAAIAERYVLDAIRDFDRNKAFVVSGDDRLITNRRDIIDY